MYIHSHTYRNRMNLKCSKILFTVLMSLEKKNCWWAFSLFFYIILPLCLLRVFLFVSSCLFYSSNDVQPN